MKTLLRIDASLRAEGSHSRALADRYEELWIVAHPGGRVVRRDLGRDFVPHLAQAMFDDSGAPGGSRELSDELIDELVAANGVLVSAPLYNFGPPSALKAWCDHVVRSGRTFAHEDGRYRGLLGGRSACLITARGGLGGAEPDQVAFLRAVFGFLGFDPIESVALEGTAEDGARRRASLALARARVDGLFREDQAARACWVGEFTLDERAEIGALRACQRAAIETGDAELYSELCTEDVQLLLQGRDLADGRDAFLACERVLFERTRFRAVRQFPLRIERQGTLAVEIGRQEVELDGAADDAFRARRKYLHVLRRTARGWRFAALGSSNDE